MQGWHYGKGLIYYRPIFRLKKLALLRARGGGGGGLLPYKRLTGMCHWMGSHFHDWIDSNGVAFSIELLEWGRKFSVFWGKTVLLIYG